MKKPFYIIGAGIIGSSIAREIRLRNLGDVVVIEKESSLGMHASGRNSGVIHSGINQKPGTLKSKMCVEGSRLLRMYCQDHNVPMEDCGTLVVARDQSEIERLEDLFEMGKKAGVPGLRIIDRSELSEREPNVKGEKALFSPTGAIVDSKKLLEKIAEESKSLGAEYVMSQKVADISGDTIITNCAEFEFRHLINCAGLYADKIAHLMNLGLEYVIVPFKGDYKRINANINSMVYQVPDLRYPFLGVHLTKSIDGSVLAGPNASLSLRGRESYDGRFNFTDSLNILKSKNFWRLALSKEFIRLAYNNARISLSERAFIKEINELLKDNITSKDVQDYRSGIRSQIVDKQGRMVNEFLIERTHNSTHILNAVSPGMTSCLAFAKYVVDNYISSDSI